MKKPTTTCFEFRGDIKILSGLLRFLTLNGVSVESKSQLIRLSLKFLYNLLVVQGRLAEFETFEEAYTYFNQMLGSPNRENRQLSTLIKSMQEESIRDTASGAAKRAEELARLLDGEESEGECMR